MAAAPFADLVRGHVRQWNRDRPQPGGAFGSQGEVTPIQALAWLSAEAGLPRGTLERLLADGDRAKVTIELRVAEAIAYALDQPWLVAGIAVIPNPHASEEARVECCGSGSTYALAV